MEIGMITLTMRKMRLGKLRDMWEVPLKPTTVQEFGLICLPAAGRSYPSLYSSRGWGWLTGSQNLFFEISVWIKIPCDGSNLFFHYWILGAIVQPCLHCEDLLHYKWGYAEIPMDITMSHGLTGTPEPLVESACLFHTTKWTALSYTCYLVLMSWEGWRTRYWFLVTFPQGCPEPESSSYHVSFTLLNSTGKGSCGCYSLWGLRRKQKFMAKLNNLWT